MKSELQKALEKLNEIKDQLSFDIVKIFIEPMEHHIKSGLYSSSSDIYLGFIKNIINNVQNPINSQTDSWFYTQTLTFVVETQLCNEPVKEVEKLFQKFLSDIPNYKSRNGKYLAKPSRYAQSWFKTSDETILSDDSHNKIQLSDAIIAELRNDEILHEIKERKRLGFFQFNLNPYAIKPREFFIIQIDLEDCQNKELVIALAEIPKTETLENILTTHYHQDKYKKEKIESCGTKVERS